MAAYAPVPDAMVYSSGSSVREDVSGPGTWAFMPARLGNGETVVINTGSRATLEPVPGLAGPSRLDLRAFRHDKREAAIRIVSL